jgi:hypothetical protein
MATKAKKKSAKSESLPQLTKPGTQKKQKNTRSPPVEPITGLEPGSKEGAVTNMMRKGSRSRKKVTFADADVTQAVPVPKKHLRR